MYGTHSAGAPIELVPLKPFGITPTTVKALPLRVMVCPTIDGSPPNRFCHSPYPSTATRRAPGVLSSSGRNVRPASGRAPSTSKKLPVTISPNTCCGSPVPPEMLSETNWCAASPENTWFLSR